MKTQDSKGTKGDGNVGSKGDRNVEEENHGGAYTDSN